MKISEWVQQQRRHVRDDWDNVMLFTGVEGSGKSTWMRQLLKALDDSFNIDRIHFNQDEFLGQAPNLPRFSATCWDEARLNKRRAMHGTTLEILDFLQDCRGLNLHIGICFPHEHLLDSAVKDHRVKWNWHVTKRGVVILRQRAKKTIHTRRGSFDSWYWRPIKGFTFNKDTGELKEQYDAKKEAHMRRGDETTVEGMIQASGGNVDALPLVDEILSELSRSR